MAATTINTRMASLTAIRRRTTKTTAATRSNARKAGSPNAIRGTIVRVPFPDAKP